MSVKTIFCIIFFVLLLDLLYVKAEDLDSQSGNAQQSDTKKRIKEFLEQKIRERDQSEVENILKYLDLNRQRKQVKNSQNQFGNEHNLRDQKTLDDLEIKLRDQIKHLQERYANRLPLNEEYNQQFIKLKEDLQKIIELIKRIEDRQIRELREKEQRELQIVRQKINERREFDKKQENIELALKDRNVQNQRTLEQEILKIIEQKLLENVQRMQDWHNKNQPIDNTHEQILIELNKFWLEWTKLTNRIDEQRIKKRNLVIEELTQKKKSLDMHKQYELEIRKLQPAPKSEATYVQRQKDEFIEDRLVNAIYTRINYLLQQLGLNCSLNSEFMHQIDLLNQDWQKLVVHVEIVKQRRNLENNLFNQEKQGQKRPQFQQQQSGQDVKRRKM